MTDYKQTQNAYDQIVQAYARRNHGAVPANLLPLAQMLVRHVSPSGQVLEIGCGTGRDMAWFELQGIRVTGIDLSAGMLTFARSLVHGPLCLMNMCQIGLSAGYFDGAWSAASLLHLPKQTAPQALREIKRVLKPGGMLVVSVQEGDGEGWEESYVPGVRRFFARYQGDEMAMMLSRAGFALRTCAAARGGRRDWLSYVCTVPGRGFSAS